MPKRISILTLQQVRELRQQGKSIRRISEALQMSRNTVRRYIRDDDGGKSESGEDVGPGWTSRLNWEEICKKKLAGYQFDQLHKRYAPEGVSYWSFNRFLNKKLNTISAQVVIPQTHKPGEKVQVDYTDGLLVYDLKWRKPRKTQLFVGVLPFSSYTFGVFSFDQKLPSFLRSHEAMWQYFGGVTPYVVPDNLKSAVTKAHRYDPDINQSYCDFGNHYGFAVLPTRPRKPRDKGAVESAVGVIQRSFYQDHKDRVFRSIDELNQEFRSFLDDFNSRIMKDYGISRKQRFEVEKDKLLQLPRRAYEFVEWKSAKVHPDCHLQIQHCYYSVPFKFVGQQLQVKVSDRLIEVFSKDLEPIAVHQLNSRKGSRSTQDSHLPEEKLQACQFEIKQAIAKSQSIGPSMHEMMMAIFSGPRPLIGLRKAQGMLRCWGKDGIDQKSMEYAAGQCLTFSKYRSDYFKQCALAFSRRGRSDSPLSPIRNQENIYLRS